MQGDHTLTKWKQCDMTMELMIIQFCAPQFQRRRKETLRSLYRQRELRLKTKRCSRALQTEANIRYWRLLPDFLQCYYQEKVKVKSCPTFCDPTDYGPPGPPVHGTFQARILGVGFYFLLQLLPIVQYYYRWKQWQTFFSWVPKSL